MSDPIYNHDRLAAVYDSFDAERHDLDAYVALAAELDSRHVIDLGCGTGCLALRLAAAGHTVIAGPCRRLCAGCPHQTLL